MNKRPIYTYEMVLFSGKHFALTDFDYADVKQKISKGVAVILMPDGSLVSKGNIASVERKQMTMADTEPGKLLPLGELKGDTSGPGYQSFLKAWQKFDPKGYARKMRQIEEQKLNGKEKDGQDNSSTRK